jgi:hypothetical protein
MAVLTEIIVSFTAQCLSGECAFGALWDIKEDGSGDNTLVLNTIVSKKENCYSMSGTAITIPLISNNNKKSNIFIDGHAIYNFGCSCLKSCKKMLAFWKKFLNSDRELPFGTNEDDVDKFIG